MSPKSDESQEKSRRWHLILGGDDDNHVLSDRDRRLSQALTALYGDADADKKSGLGRSAPKVAKWLGDIREFFPSSVVQVVQKDAFERLGLKQMLLEPEFLSAMEADVHLVADLVSLRSAMPDKTLEVARHVIKKVVDELLKKLEHKTQEATEGQSINPNARTVPALMTLIGSEPCEQIYSIIKPNTNPSCLRHWWALCVSIADLPILTR